MSQSLKYLNVAEKPIAAAIIANYLSNGRYTERYGINSIYEFESEVMDQKCLMVMTSVSGHLLRKDFEASQYRDWTTGADHAALFSAPIVNECPENRQYLAETLRSEIRGCRGLIIWTDCDREGENIGFEIIQVCREENNNIEVYRAKFSEITAASVRRALRTLEQPDQNVSDAVDVRRELDLRFGRVFTRLQTDRIRRDLGRDRPSISYGSCQFPTLGFVVESYKNVEAFVPQTFWEIKVFHTLNNITVDFAWESGRQFDRENCEFVYRTCADRQAEVIDVTTKPVRKLRPLPLTTVEYQKLASSELNIRAKDAMDVAEKLYCQGMISYPRTNTDVYSEDMNMELQEIVNMFTGHDEVGTFAQRILSRGGPNPRQGSRSDNAHPPIHPVRLRSNLRTRNEELLYDLIVRSFLACCSEDAEGQETLVTVKVGDEKFVASGLNVTATNYLDVYPYEQWPSKEIHTYEQGQTFDPTSIDLVVGSTSPPELLTESDLIDLMVEHGIGTDATHATHMETIATREYITMTEDNRFQPEPLGLGLVEGYEAIGLKCLTEPDLRAQLIVEMEAIAEGRKQKEEVLREQIAQYRGFYQTLSQRSGEFVDAMSRRLMPQN